MAPKIIEELNGYSKKELNEFAIAYLLLHDYEFKNRYNLDSILINTLHHPTFSKFSEWVDSYNSGLIIRDPTEIVISRTFRKNEYKSYLVSKSISSVSETEYLDSNIRKVNNFYKKAMKCKYDAFLQFNSIVSGDPSILYNFEKMFGKCRCRNPEDVIKRVVNSGNETNKFNGDRVEVPGEIKEYIKQNIVDLSVMHS